MSRALALVAQNPPRHRTLTALLVQLQDETLSSALRPYTVDGNLGYLLDAGETDIGDAAHEVFELRHLMDLSDRVLIPTLLYLFHHVERKLDERRPTLMIVDEAWIALGNSLFGRRISDWLLTWRKKNGAVVLGTQSLSQLEGLPNRSIIFESCPTRILLPNPEALTDEVAKLYRGIGLNETEIRTIATATPKRHYYFKSPRGSRLFEMGLGPVALGFLAAAEGRTMEATARRAEALIAEHGPDWTRFWLREQGLDAFTSSSTPQTWEAPMPITRNRLSRLLASALVAAAAATAPAFVHAQIPIPGIPQIVFDPKALYEQGKTIQQRIEMIEMQKRQLQYQIDALRKLSSPSWRQIGALMYQMDAVMREGNALAYSLSNIDEQFQRTFPGYRVPVDYPRRIPRAGGPAHWPPYVPRSTWPACRRATSGTANRPLAQIKARMGSAEGHTSRRSSLQSTLIGFTADELSALRQAVATQTNAQAVYQAYQLNQQAPGTGRIRCYGRADAEPPFSSPRDLGRTVEEASMNHYVRALIAVSFLSLGACQPSEEDIANGDEPIQALSATVLSTRYAQAYWRQQADGRSDVWQRAQAVCENADLGEKPNCALVQGIAQFDEMVERTRNRPPPPRETRDVQLGRPNPRHTLPAPRHHQPVVQ